MGTAKTRTWNQARGSGFEAARCISNAPLLLLLSPASATCQPTIFRQRVGNEEQRMQQTRQVAVLGVAERKRVEAVVETLTTRQSAGETLAEVAHDARNMVTALGLYCDLLEEPGVLAVPFAHYGSELRLVAAASRRLVEKLVALDSGPDADFDTGLNTGLDAGAAREPQTPEFEAAASDGWTASGLPDPELQQALNRSLDRSLDRSLQRGLDRHLDRRLDR